MVNNEKGETKTEKERNILGISRIQKIRHTDKRYTIDCCQTEMEMGRTLGQNDRQKMDPESD